MFGTDLEFFAEQGGEDLFGDSLGASPWWTTTTSTQHSLFSPQAGNALEQAGQLSVSMRSQCVPGPDGDEGHDTPPTLY